MKWVGQNKRKLVMVLITVFIVQLLLNAMVYSGLWYLQENKNLRFGYRLESTDYHENIQLNNFFVDMNGYTKISTKTGLNENFEVESSSKAERYDLNQNLLWEVDISQISQPQNIAISSEVIIETERFLTHSSGENNPITLSRIFNVFQVDNVSIKMEYIQPLNFTFNPSFESSYHNELQTFGYLVGDYYVNLEYATFDQYNTTSQDWETISINNSLIFFNTHSLIGSRISLTDPNVSLYSISQLTESTIYLYAVKPDDQLVEIFEVDLEEGLLNEVDQIEITSCSSHDCGYSIIPYHQKLTILMLDPSDVRNQVILQTSFISTGKKDMWVLQMEEDWIITSKHVIDDTIVLGESTFEEPKTNSRLILLKSGNNQIKKINLLEYDDQDGGYIFRIFELNHNKIGIVKARRSSDGFYDIQVLTLNPTDIEGLIFSHELVPHVLATLVMMIVTVIILYRKTIIEPSSEVYPKP
jgi:hypothetical protein